MDIFKLKELKEEQTGRNEVLYQLHLQRPRFMEQVKLSPTERGTAYHTLMQHVHFDVEPSLSIVQETIAELILKQIITQPQADVIDPKVIMEFLQSPVGELLRGAEWVMREVPFSFGLPVAEAHAGLLSELADNNLAFTINGDDLANEVVLIQGVIDCLFYTGDQLYLLDYKSDRVSPHLGGIEALTRHYTFQLELYQRAIEEMTGQAVDEKWLYFFDQGQAVKL